MPENPFRFGPLALDDSFTDRHAEVAELKADALNGQDVVVFAPRRYGKSSLVWRVSQELIAEKVLVAELDLMTAPTKEKLAEKLAKTIHDDLASVLFKAKERVRVFQDLRITPTITVDAQDGSLGFSFQAGRSPEDIDATLERLFELPARLAADRDRKVVLVLDEFQEVVDIDPHLTKLMRAVFQRQPDVAHLYLGSKRHMMERIFNDANEPFWRSAKRVELGVIAPELFRSFIEQRFTWSRRRIAAETLDALLAITHGHPYATQELCYALWQQTAVGAAATPDDLDVAVSQVLASEHAHFTLLWDRAAANQRLLLQALAREAGHPLSGDYRSRHGLPTSATVQKALKALERDDLVARAGGAARISEPFLGEWIRRLEQ
ncbi:MAG TPA: ATP-binding protein [Solirubrobacteraceae bacterium]|nr:ATP-binding protein [Solirubrobacteraceae bacterium]